MTHRRTSRLLSLAAWAAAGLVLGGCDTLNGVWRTAHLDEMPPADCVAGVLATQPGIGNIERRTGVPHEYLTMQGWVTPLGLEENFVYRATDGAMLAFLIMGPGTDSRTYFEQYMGAMGRLPSQRSVDAARPVMASIERRVGAECGHPELPTAIVERCTKGLACGPIGDAASAPH